MGRRIPQPPEAFGVRPEAFGVRHPSVDGCRVSRVCGLGWVRPPLSNSWIIIIIWTRCPGLTAPDAGQI